MRNSHAWGVWVTSQLIKCYNTKWWRIGMCTWLYGYVGKGWLFFCDQVRIHRKDATLCDHTRIWRKGKPVGWWSQRKRPEYMPGDSDWHYQVCVNLRQLMCTQCQVRLQFYVTRVQVSRHFITLRSHCLAGNRGRQAGGSIYSYNNYMNHGQPRSTWMDLLN